MIAANCGTPPLRSRVIAKDPAKSLHLGKNFILQRQKHAAPNQQGKRAGARTRRRSVARRITFLVVAGKKRAGFHVASLATIMHGSPRHPDTVTTPAAEFSPTPRTFCTQPESDLKKRRVLVEQSTNPFTRRQAPHLAAGAP